MTHWRVLLCPDSLKGVLTAAEAAEALGRGLARIPEAPKVCFRPMSDGGDGLTEVVRSAIGGELRPVQVEDALGRPLEAAYLLLSDGTAIVESAAAIGLAMLGPGELDPHRASSRGLGLLLQAALTDPQVKEVMIGLGGVATVDGGVGLREVVPALSKPVTVVSDVENPLLGPRGAAAVFGPQKGADPEDVEALERRLVELGLPDHVAEAPGAGAGGGLGACLLELGATLQPGIDTVVRLTGLGQEVERADLIITGEGRVDHSSIEGKVVSGVCRLAAAAGTPVVVVGGLVDDAARKQLHLLGATTVLALSGEIHRAAADLEILAEELGRLLIAPHAHSA